MFITFNLLFVVRCENNLQNDVSTQPWPEGFGVETIPEMLTILHINDTLIFFIYVRYRRLLLRKFLMTQIAPNNIFLLFRHQRFNQIKQSSVIFCLVLI